MESSGRYNVKQHDSASATPAAAATTAATAAPATATGTGSASTVSGIAPAGFSIASTAVATTSTMVGIASSANAACGAAGTAGPTSVPLTSSSPSSSSAPPAPSLSITTGTASSSSSANISTTPTPGTSSVQTGGGTSSGGGGTAQGQIRHRPAVFDKLEQLVRDMQDDEHGVPVRSQKLFLTSIPAAFMGYDLIEWLMDRLTIEDSLEAVHLANLLCQFGYYFPVNELKNLIVKDDSSLYRFQTPYYWPSQNHTPDNIEYAIYLAKRSQRNKQKHGLEDYEVEAYNNLKKILTNKWDFVSMQAEEQLKLNKDRKKGEKIITDSQEKAYWRVYRPPPGFTTVVETSPVPTREQRVKARSRTREHLTEEMEFLKNYVAMSRSKVSLVVENLTEYTEIFYEFDPMLSCVGPSNPWITDDQTFWILGQSIVDCPTEKRVRKWSISLEDLMSDSLGVQELMAYMKKEYSHENLRFWLSVQELRTGPGTEPKIKKKVKEIWDEFLSPGAKAEINIDSKTMDATKAAIRAPTRFTFEVAAEHVYTLLLKKDCYPRFIRSEHFKSLLANSINPGNQKKRFPFTFNVKRGDKKISAGAGGPGSTTMVNSGGMPTGTTGGTMGSVGSMGSMGGTLTSSLSNPKDRTAGMTLEDYSIYGADGADDNSGMGCNRILVSYQSRDTADESICPWDADPVLESSSTALASIDQDQRVTQHRRSSRRHRHHHHSQSTQSQAAEPASVGAMDATASSSSSSAVPPAATDNAVSHAGHAPNTTSTCDTSPLLVREASGRSSRSSRERDPSGHHHRHHEHHHHEHHHNASKRAKSKSKRKKSMRAAGTSRSSSATVASGADKENVSDATEQQPAAVAVAASCDVLSKCTQTATQAELLRAAAAAAAAATAATDASEDSQQQQPMEETEAAGTTRPDATSGAETGTEATGATAVTGPSEGTGAAAGATLATARKELGGSFTSSTEVCPWEDEDNSRESHEPFVKTYATLGYL